jgi:diaminopimelate epimerase
MKNIPFVKYHGAGNDFILIDNRKTQLQLSTALIKKLCDRHFGIGADGLMLLHDAETFDFGMVYYNADGKESTMCGNGGRCLCAFARSLGIIDSSAHFIAIDGEHEANIMQSAGMGIVVKLKMKDVNYIRKDAHDFILDTGSPHFVRFVKNVHHIDVMNIGRKIRYLKGFNNSGINVNFAEIKEKSLFVRTYERGVESETLSCGTGATAAAIAYAYKTKGKALKSVKVETTGGILKVLFKTKENVFRDVWLEGPAEFVFSGQINLQAL